MSLVLELRARGFEVSGAERAPSSVLVVVALAVATVLYAAVNTTTSDAKSASAAIRDILSRLPP
eukprot:scaffold100_cov357-Prasinococcus_capsulatus_cf.AAC.3